MTPKQTERLKKKILEIKRTLAEEKRKYGGYDDSRGLRYLPTKYFIQLSDYSGGLSYVKWFDKNFPDDFGFPDFLFEWTIILFKNHKLKEAEKKAFQVFCSNTYLFDKFFGRKTIVVNKWETSNLESSEFAENLHYSSGQQELADFSEWLKLLMSTKDFISKSDKYISIHKRLLTEDDEETRLYLVCQASQLEQSL